MDNRYDVSLSREIFVPREVMFALWTQAEHVSQWYAPGPDFERDAAVDANSGGRFTFRWHNAHDSWSEQGEYLDVDSPERLVMSLTFADGFVDRLETKLTVRFVEVNDASTRIELLQQGFPTEEQCEQARQNWQGKLDELMRYLSAI